MSTSKVIYWIVTGLMCLIFLFSAGIYFTQYEMVTGFFRALQFPIWLVYPLAVAKIMGVLAIISRRSALFKEWAYAGFFFDTVLATTAHHFAGHSIIGLSSLALILVLASRFMEERAFEK